MPYAFDLVRLTASVELAPDTIVADRDAADAILEDYRDGLKQPGPALLDEQEIWIRDYVKCSDVKADHVVDAIRHDSARQVEHIDTRFPDPGDQGIWDALC